MSTSNPNNSTASSERRSSSRLLHQSAVRVAVEACVLEGTLENQSTGGMFVMLDDGLHVEVTVGTGSDTEVSRARLTRVAALPGQRSGWGLEIISDHSAA